LVSYYYEDDYSSIPVFIFWGGFQKKDEEYGSTTKKEVSVSEGAF